MAVTCGDRSGFYRQRAALPYLNDAVKILGANYATADADRHGDEDRLWPPMGPLSCSTSSVSMSHWRLNGSVYVEFRGPGYAPAPMLEHLVTASYLGRKTGAGLPARTRTEASG
ncbi:MAG: hypothetical protein IPL94_09935 [Tetrasphaera sp.]|nr:hypothetical protein [Tetrasphaera sp.]